MWKDESYVFHKMFASSLHMGLSSNNSCSLPELPSFFLPQFQFCSVVETAYYASCPPPSLCCDQMASQSTLGTEDDFIVHTI